MQSPTYKLAEQIWDAEEIIGVQHYLQSKEQFIKQLLHLDENDLAIRLLDLDRILTNKNMETWKEIITDHFNHLQQSNEPKAPEIDFWMSKYIKLLPTALRDDIIDEEEVCALLEASGDYFGGFETEQYLVEAWLPWNQILERQN